MAKADQIALGAKFILGIIAFYTLFRLLFSLADLAPLKAFTAAASYGLLKLAGVPATLSFGSDPVIRVGDVDGVISNLCAGDLEIALVLAVVLSTWDRTWKQRFVGSVSGILLILIANPIRIATVLAAGAWFNWDFSSIVHDILFRLMLILVIVVFYFAWYVKYEKFFGWLDAKKNKMRTSKKRHKP